MNTLGTMWDRALGQRWARLGLALFAGLAAALAHPPFGILIGLAGYPLLMRLAEESTTTRGAFWMGWLAGFAYFGLGCWWVAEAFLVNPDQAWMAPFAASLLPAGIGLFWGAATALYHRLAPSGVRRVLMFAALFVTFEWLRGHVLTGFPWNPAGATWEAGSPISQMASVVGVYGLSLLTVALACAFAPLTGPGGRRPRLVAAGLGLTLLAGLFAFGLVRLQSARPEPTETLIRIVQADVDQESKWTPEAYRGIVDRYLTLTAQPSRLVGAPIPDVVVWPEGALPASANDVFASPDAVRLAQAAASGQTLLIGLGRGEPAPDGSARYFNALFALHDVGAGGLAVTAVYDKHRLVPFGEYLPLGSLMSALGIRSLVHMPADFAPGPRPAPIDLLNAPRVQPLICYESLYPGFTRAGADRPGWIVNVSNDAWFGRTSGPQQHLNLASYRAVETGLPVVRATPTGVSALIDPWGRVMSRLETGEMGVIDVQLPRPAEITGFGRFGHWSLFILVLLCLVLSVPWRRKQRFREAAPLGLYRRAGLAKRETVPDPT